MQDKKTQDKKTLEYPYEIRTLTMGKEDIKLCYFPNQRQIRETQVNRILRQLRDGIHFDSMLVVNVNNGTKKIRIIDGGHRVTALTKYFEEFPDRKVKVSLVVYKDLSEESERKIYTKWNLGAKQTLDDFINSYKKEIHEFEDIILELPVAVYPSKNKMRLRYVISAYFSSKNKNFHGVTYTAMEFIEQMKKLTYDDVESIKNTFEIINEIFNPDSLIDFTRLPAFKNNVFTPIYYLVSNNKVLLGKQYVIKRMKTILAKKVLLETFKGYTGRTGMVEIYNRCKFLLNDGVEHKFK